MRDVDDADSIHSERYPLTSQLVEDNRIPEFGRCATRYRIGF